MILDKLISVICGEFDISEEDIDEDTLLEDIISEDIDTSDLLYALEREFDVELSDELSGDISVGELAELIEETVG